MNKNDSGQDKHKERRKKAETSLKADAGSLGDIPANEVRNLLHELQVHQIELEMQNEELRAAQQTIEESRSKYADLYDFAPIGYFTMDKNSLILDANLTGSEQLGLERSGLINKPFSLYVHEDDREAFHLHCRQLLQSKIRLTCEVRITRRDRSVFHAQLVSNAVQDITGTFRKIRTAVTDITGRVEAEEKLYEALQISRKRESEISTLLASARSVAETANDAIITIDADGFIITWNRGAETIFGYTSDEAAGKNLTLLIPDDLHSAHINGFNKVVSEDKSILAGKTIEMTGLRKDGMQFPLELSISKWESGGDIFFTSIIRDISERWLIDDELSKHRNRLMELVNERTSELEVSNSLLKEEISVRKKAEAQARLMALFAELNPSPVLRFDINGKVMMANPAAMEVFNMDKPEGIPLSSILPGIEALDLCTCIREGTLITHSVEIGSRFFYFILRGIPELECGQIYGSDITGKKKAEEEALRSAHLASLGELAAGVAHEINNPINGIINYSQILANKSVPGSREHDIASRIIKEGDRIAGIVNSLLSFARDRTEDKRPVHIHSIIYESLALTGAQLEKEGITPAVNIQQNMHNVKAQPQQLAQVFLNLISNARYALNKKYPLADKNKVFRISAEEVMDKDGTYILVKFYDSGTGIPAEIQDKVMSPFFTTKPGNVGTGLGLSVTHGIITNHKGSISINSSAGEFTDVMIKLPAYPPEQ